ncbi:MAG: trehalose-phosphatase [Bacteroidia bacterium]
MNINLTERFRDANNRLILLDYDGTLTDYELHPDKAIPSEQLLKLLEKLNNKPNTRLIIVSGRSSKSLDQLFNNSSLEIIAEHGAKFKHNNHWNLLVSENDKWKENIFPALNDFTKKFENTFIEEKETALAWHYRNCTEKTGWTASRELIIELKKNIGHLNLKIIDGNKVVEIMTSEANKGKAIQYIIEQNNYDCILCVGDDRTDEDMFEYLLKNKNAITIKVGQGDTFAKDRLKSVQQVILFLKQLSG